MLLRNRKLVWGFVDKEYCMQCTGSNCSALILYRDFGIWSKATRLKTEKAKFMKKLLLVLRLKQHMILKKNKSYKEHIHRETST